MLLVNFILEKNFKYCTNVHSYLEKGNKYNSTYKSQCFKEDYDFMLGHTHYSDGPHAARGPRVGQPWSRTYIDNSIFFNPWFCSIFLIKIFLPVFEIFRKNEEKKQHFFHTRLPCRVMVFT